MTYSEMVDLYYMFMRRTWEFPKEYISDMVLIESPQGEPSLEKTIYKLYKINVENLTKTRLYICRDYHIQPSEIGMLPYYEYETMTLEINEIRKAEDEQQKNQQEQYEGMRDSFKAPKMDGFKAPQMPSMPKVSIPKF